MKSLSIACVLATLFACSQPAWAGEAEARSFFAEGRQKRIAGDCEGAIPLFRKAFETYPDGLGSLRNLAECEEDTKRFASARRSYWDLRLASLKTSDPKYAGWDVDATNAHARLGDLVAKLVVTVRGAPTAQVQVNGSPLDPRLYGHAVEQDLGTVQVVLRDGSKEPPAQRLQLEAGKTYEIELVSTLTRSTAASTAAGPGSAAPTDDSTSSGLRVGSIVSFVVAGAAGIGFGVSLGVRAGALSTVEQDCTPSGDGFSCPSSAQDAVGTGETSSDLVTGMGITAAFAGGLGVALLAASFATAPDEPQLTGFIFPTPGGIFGGLGGTF